MDNKVSIIECLIALAKYVKDFFKKINWTKKVRQIFKCLGLTLAI